MLLSNNSRMQFWHEVDRLSSDFLPNNSCLSGLSKEQHIPGLKGYMNWWVPNAIIETQNCRKSKMIDEDWEEIDELPHYPC